jgi:hypothetical protein
MRGLTLLDGDVALHLIYRIRNGTLFLNTRDMCMTLRKDIFGNFYLRTGFQGRLPHLILAKSLALRQ